MMRNLKPGAVGVALVALVAFAPTAPAASTADRSSDTYRLLELFGDVFERVRADYVTEVSDQELVEAAIQGMLGSLDPHSSFLNTKSFRDMQVQTKGEFGGLGIEVTMEDGYVKVVSPIDNTPAFRAGLEAGDLITHLDGQTVQGMSLADAVERMRGRVGSDIVLTVRRGPTDTFDVTITRDRIQIRSVRHRVEGDVGYIRISSFSERSEENLKAAVEQIKEQVGSKLRGFVLDMRNNPGGLLDQAVAVSDAFLDRGEVVSTRGRTEDNAQRYHATQGDVAGGLPIVVLINSGSASASEIVAGALQDHGRAIVVGTRSFGKGSVQTIIPLGRNGAMKLTTQRYYTPSGRSIQGSGIDPDIIVEQARLEPLQQGRERHESDLRGALGNGEENRNRPDQSGREAAPPVQEKAPESGAAPSASPDEEEKPQALGERSSEDYQLMRAIDLLRGISLYRERVVALPN